MTVQQKMPMPSKPCWHLNAYHAAAAAAAVCTMLLPCRSWIKQLQHTIDTVVDSKLQLAKWQCSRCTHILVQAAHQGHVLEFVTAAAAAAAAVSDAARTNTASAAWQLELRLSCAAK
jgi:hypothetical protein